MFPVLEILHPRHFGKRAFSDFLYYFVIYGAQNNALLKHVTTWSVSLRILFYDYDAFVYHN